MFPVNLYTTSGLSILLHGVNSLPDATSYDNRHLNLILRKAVFCFFANNKGADQSSHMC